jgi:hypothetical protein
MSLAERAVIIASILLWIGVGWALASLLSQIHPL